jgi:diguanylate cyclase (GGDEF)-like protein
MRDLVENHNFAIEGSELQITISVGVATTLGDSNLSVQRLINLADKKLFEAKHSGKNRVAA